MSISLELVTELHVKIAEPLDLGHTPQGWRRVIPITGGTFEGPKLRGKVLPGGADWNVLHPDGRGHLYARYTIETDDGALISVLNEGFSYTTKDVLERRLRGEPVPPSEYYIKTIPRFETASEKYYWMNYSVFVGTLNLHPGGGVQLQFYLVK
jgi:hypothetical protein